MTRFIRGYDGMVSDPKPRRSSAPKADLVKPKQPEYSFWRDTIWYRDDPGLKTWFRSEWRDLLPLLLFILIPLSMSLWAKPLTPKYFPLPPVAGSAYSYPLLPEYINTWVSAVVSFGVPFAVMGLISIFRIGSFWDCNSAVCLFIPSCSSSYISNTVFPFSVAVRANDKLMRRLL